MNQDPVESFSLSRRRVLASGAVVAPMVLAGPSLAWGAKASSNKTVTLGVIGCGRQARNHVVSNLKNPRIRILAVCDVEDERKQDMASRVNEAYGNKDCGMYLDYRELLARDDIDAVLIATPDHWHATQTIHAAQAGKHIYCEKPLTHTILEAQLIVKAVRKAGVVFQTGSQQRSAFGGRFATAAERVRNGMIGKCEAAVVGVGAVSRSCNLPAQELKPGLDWDRWLGPAPQMPFNEKICPRGVHNHWPRWRDYREFAGGFLADFGAHNFDIAQWAFNKDATSPTLINPPVSRRDTYGASAVYEDGTTLLHFPSRGGVTFAGNKGSIYVSRKELEGSPAAVLDDPLPENAVVLPRPKSHMNDWLNCIESGEETIAPIEAGARTAVVCHLFAIAYWYGRRLKFDPKSWSFSGDDEANTWLDYQRRSGYELPDV